MALSYRDYTPPDDVLRKLEISRQKAALIQTRDVHCPYCT